LLHSVDRKTADILVIDTEGMDHMICDQALDLADPPSILHFEYVHSPKEDVHALFSKLSQKNYGFVRNGLNITAAQLLQD
jgi:hypothetical protein